MPSETARNIFVAEGFPADRTVLKDNFTPDPGPRPAAPSRSRTVVFVGRLRPEKGTHALLEAWRRSAHAGLELVVIGDDPDRAALEAAAPADVVFRGTLPPEEVAQAMLAARALVFPSLWQEPFGLILIEAMAAGLPVVGFRVADAARIVGPGGVLVEQGDVPGLAGALDALADDALVDRLGRAGRERWEAAFSPAPQAAALAAAYERAVAVRRGRAARP